MTPCEKLGYKVGDKFEVVDEDSKYVLGSMLELVKDDGTTSPHFKVLPGEEGIYDIGFEYLGYIKKILTDYPTFDFKINLSNMTDTEKRVTRDWLVDVAKSRGIREVALEYNKNFYWLEADRFDTVCSVEDDKYDYYKGDSTTELSLTFSEPTITSWEALEASPKKTEKELQLESLVDKLKSQLEEAQKQLEDINSK